MLVWIDYSDGHYSMKPVAAPGKSRAVELDSAEGYRARGHHVREVDEAVFAAYQAYINQGKVFHALLAEWDNQFQKERKD